MTPTAAYGQRKKRYRYYASPPPRRTEADEDGGRAIRRIPGPALEAKLSEICRRLVPAQAANPLALLIRVEVYPETVHLLMPIDLLPRLRGRLLPGEAADRDPVDPARLRLALPLRLQFHGGSTRIVGGDEPGGRPDPVLVKALRAAHAMLVSDPSGALLLETAPSSTYDRRLVRLAFLAPELQRAILCGRQPAGLTLGALMDARLPALWAEQMRMLKRFCAWLNQGDSAASIYVIQD